MDAALPELFESLVPEDDDPEEPEPEPESDEDEELDDEELSPLPFLDDASDELFPAGLLLDEELRLSLR